jgi:hypothetical protein
MKTNQQKRVLIWTTVEVANVVPWSGGVRLHHIEAEDIVAVLLDDGTWMTVNAKDINWKHYTQAQSPGWRNVVAYGVPAMCVADAIV